MSGLSKAPMQDPHLSGKDQLLNSSRMPTAFPVKPPKKPCMAKKAKTTSFVQLPLKIKR